MRNIKSKALSERKYEHKEQLFNEKKTWQRKVQSVMIVAAGLPAGLLIGIAANALMKLEPFDRWFFTGCFIFFTAVTCFITTFYKAERAHEISLAAYDERHAYSTRLLRRMCAVIEDESCSEGEAVTEILSCLHRYQNQQYGVVLPLSTGHKSTPDGRLLHLFEQRPRRYSR